MEESWKNGFWTDQNGVSWQYDWGKNTWLQVDQQAQKEVAANPSYSVEEQVMHFDATPAAPDFQKLRKEKEKERESYATFPYNFFTQLAVTPFFLQPKKRKNEEVTKTVDESKPKKKKKKKKPKNKSVFISNIPKDYKLEELTEIVEKYGGILMKDPDTREKKIKFYEDPQKEAKEALATYFKPESVNQAIMMLDGYEVRPKFAIKVEEAKFEDKKIEGEEKPKKKVEKKKGARKYDQRKSVSSLFFPTEDIKNFFHYRELDWDEEDNRVHVIIKNLFSLQDAEKGGWNFFDDLKRELREMLEEIGQVETLKIFEYNPEGVAAVKFKQPLSAQRAVRILEGSTFSRRKLSADFYDLFTNYDVQPTEEQKQKKQKMFDEWVGNQAAFHPEKKPEPEKTEERAEGVEEEEKSDEDAIDNLKHLLDDESSSSSDESEEN